MAKSISKSSLILIAAIVVIALWGVSTYNSLVSSDESVTNAWSQVENVYQRRMDLIPNLVKTVQGAADFERNTLSDVIEARSKASSVQVDANNLTEENLAAFQQAQDGLSAALSRLMVVVERYPELKANQNFIELQSQLEGTENRITVERQKYNDVVKSYNASVRKFPRNIIASLFNFDPKAYFKAAEGADKAPEVNFNF